MPEASRPAAPGLQRAPGIAHVVLAVGQRVARAVQRDDLLFAQLRERGLEAVVFGLRGPLGFGRMLGGAGARGLGLDPGPVIGSQLVGIEVLVGDHPFDVGVVMKT